MKCEEAAEFVSALSGGQRIPREAAEHLGVCQGCRMRLNDYTQMGIELRRLANLEVSENVKTSPWEQKERSGKRWWLVITRPILLPRFAVFVVGLLVAGLSAGLVLVRAQDQGPWLELDVKRSNASAPNSVCIVPGARL